MKFPSIGKIELLIENKKHTPEEFEISSTYIIPAFWLLGFLKAAGKKQFIPNPTGLILGVIKPL